MTGLKTICLLLLSTQVAADAEGAAARELGTLVFSPGSLFGNQAPPPPVVDPSPVPTPAPVQPSITFPATQVPTPAPLYITTPAPTGPVPTVAGCASYMATTGCAWTYDNSCPGQPVGHMGLAGDDGSHGYNCCCKLLLWKSVPVAGPVVPGVVTDLKPGMVGPSFSGAGSLAYEQIPRYIKLKYKLIQWFENQKQCGAHRLNGDFPAWVGWKAVTAATPAVTTPPKGIAGNRTLFIEGFCPKLTSTEFTCVKTDNEVKARTVVGKVRLLVDQVLCTLQDISLYRMSDGFLGVRFDFSGCTGATRIGGTGTAPHVPTTASLNMGLAEERIAMVGVGSNGLGTQPTQFTEFFMGVCGGKKPADFLTALLPKFGLGGNSSKGRRCFAESANTAHVIGKGCFEDFLFFDFEDINGRLANIPARDLAALNALIPKDQHWTTPVPVPAPVPAPPMVKVVKDPVDPCAPTPTLNDEDPCAAPTTVTVTTTRFVPEVPGVVVADRLCIFFHDCACNNMCDCHTKMPQTITMTTTLIMIDPVCQDYWVENLIIAAIAWILSLWIMLFIFERCVKASFTNPKKKWVESGAPSDQMRSVMNSTTQGVAGAGGGDDTVTEVTEKGYNGWGMSFCNFILSGIITFIVVHGVCILWGMLMTALFNLEQDGIWNSIDLNVCPYTLFPVWVAIWMMLWMNLTYYYGWEKEIRKKHKSTAHMHASHERVGAGGGGFVI